MSTDASDPRAQELLLADPDRIGGLATFSRRAAELSAQASTGLRGAQHDVVWHGRAAETFRHAIGPMPARLDGLHAGFQDTAAALTAYASALAHLQTGYHRNASNLAALEAQLPGAHTEAEMARAAVRRALHTPGAAAFTLAIAQREADRTQRRLSEIEDQMRRRRLRGHELLDEFERERAGCRSRIAHARRLAPAAPIPGRLHAPVSARLAPPA